VLIFIAIVIRFRDRVDFDRVDFGVSHFKGVLYSFVDLVFTTA